MDIKIDDVQRLILANQYEIIGLLRTISKDESNAKFYLDLSKDLSDGYPAIYNHKIKNLIEANLDQAKAEFVYKILGIFGDMRDSYNKLGVEAKQDIEEWKVEFPGFDGNEENEYLSFAYALLRNGKFIKTLSKADINSHHPTIQRYQEIINKWQQLGSPNYPYTKEQILELINS